MAERYGTDLTALGGYEGGVNADNGAALVSTSSAGETALLFGPAALREIQAGVANGDFAIAPDDSTGTITAENPLPYWTFTDTSSSGNITCAVVPNGAAGSGNTLVWTVAANTSTGSAKLTRYVPVAATQDRAFAYTFEITAQADAATNRKIAVSAQFVKQDLTNTGTSTGIEKTFTEVGTSAITISLADAVLAKRTMAPADAAYLLIEISVTATASNASSRTLTIYEVRMPVGQPILLLGERTSAATFGPASMWKTGGVLNLAANLPTTWTSGTLSTTQPTLKISETLATISNGGLRAEAGVAALASPDLTTGTSFQVGISTDTQARLLVKGDGSLNFGPGSSTAQDTNLYRSAANTLKTDDSLVVAGLMTASNIASGLVTITPVANASTGVAVTGLSVLSSNSTAGLDDFSVVVSANSAADAVRTTTYSNLTFSGATLTGLTARVFRTNTTATGVSWIVIGR